MIKADTDIDIDFSNRDDALSKLRYIKASLKNGSLIKSHNTGVYFQNIPYDPKDNLSTLDTTEATNRGYFKIDFLNVSLYDGVKNEGHLIKLMNDTPLWDMLTDKFFVKKLWHIHNHFNLVFGMKPTSVIELAMVLAIIRPAKRHLQGLTWIEIEKDVWNKPNLGDIGYEHRGSFFKKSHSLSYALGIVIQMNLLVEQAT